MDCMTRGDAKQVVEIILFENMDKEECLVPVEVLKVLIGGGINVAGSKGSVVDIALETMPIVRPDSKIYWIKWFRGVTGCVLKESKDVADKIWIESNEEERMVAIVKELKEKLGVE